MLSDVSLELHKGSTLGLVGESGSGKSTLARVAGGLLVPRIGKVSFDGKPAIVDGRLDAEMRRRIQYVFQDPLEAFDPKLTIGRSLVEAIRGRFPWKRWQSEGEVRSRVEELMEWVQLDTSHLNARPRMLSGGQLQRVGIARALSTDPDVVILDEPTSALDVSIRGEILALLERLRVDRGLTYLFISHDFFSIAALADSIAVMYAGEIVEIGPAENVLNGPAHPYTHALMAAMPGQGSSRDASLLLSGEIQDAVSSEGGCPLAGRCPAVRDHCHEVKPGLEEAGSTMSACHYSRSSRPGPSAVSTFARAKSIVKMLNDSR